MIVKMVSNAVHAKLIDPSKEVRLLVSDILSYAVEGFEHMTKRPGWDGRSSFYSFKTNSFPAGFTHMVKRKLMQAGFQVQHVMKPLPEPLGPEFPVVDSFGFSDERYSYQLDTVRKLEKHGMIIAQLATGCHEKGQKVLMFDGSLKAVEDVVVGDMLMGPDSTPRNVLSLHRGRDQMYRIIPKRYGRPFVVNAGHILSLEQTKLPDCRWEAIRNGEWTNISVNDYLAQNHTFKHIWKLHRSKGIDFESDRVLPLDPYLLGLILGDGHIKANSKKPDNCSISIVSNDPEIGRFIEQWASENDHRVTITTKSGTSALTYSIVRRKRCEKKVGPNLVGQAVADLGLWESRSGDKFIPDAYKTASREARLKILAGLVDTDGHLHHGHIELVSKSKILRDDIAFVARSLGFAVSESEKLMTSGTYKGNIYYRVHISGNIDEIPTIIPRKQANPRAQKKDVHLSGFSVESVGEGDYYGFEVDDDNLYLLDDFTITHNSGKSRCARLAYARIRRKTLFLTTRGALMYQFAEACEESFGKNEVGIVGDSIWQADRPLICGMVQTLAARLANYTEDELIERHLVAQAEREKKEQDALTARLAKAKKSTEERKAAMSQLKKEQKKKRLSDEELAELITKKLAQQRKNRAETLELLRSVEFVIAEEAHEAGGNSYFDLMQACVNANYRLALTATPFMRPDAESNMRLMAVSGGIGIKVSEKQLIDLGILAKPIFQICRTQKPAKLFRSTAYARAYEIGIVEHDWRNKRMVAECIRMSRYGLTTMILVQRRAHGERLLELLSKVKLKAEFINGDDDANGRKRALARLASGEINVLIGTNILDVGVDVPSVGCIILGGGGKAEVANRQRIGRGLRAKKSGPNICFVLDFMDEYNQHLQGHAIQRREIITSTPGFAENLLPMDTDWRIDDFGFKKIA